MMQPFPKEFLEQVATDKYLTEEQRAVFVALFQDANRVPDDIAEDLFISPNAFRTRMTGVYKAFEIGGKGANKKRRLHTELLEMYRQQQGRDSGDPILDQGIDNFVERVREQVKPDITQRCGTMRVLDMAQPVGLGEIYTDVNILAKMSRTSRKDLSQIQEMVGLDLENFERFSFGEIAKERVAGLDVVKEYRKLMIWGKPGAGKTTFLKHLAMSCIRGELFPELVPFFVTLKSFAEEDGQPNLFTYLQTQAEMHGVEPERLKKIINAGRAMILLDGLDEVRQEDSRRLIKGIQDFADLWRDNFFAITCRIAAKEYTFQGGFTEVEVADFDQKQIACFVNNWFRCKGEENKATEFINALKKQKPIQELASSPLLLTLLCLVFEENFQFPQNRAELYKDGLDILLKKWDGKRAIQRDEIYKNLTVKRREQMLSEIAFKTFEKGEYFFKQSRVENLILEFIQNLPDAKNDLEALRLDSEVVLKVLEAQHGILVERAKGIYSFSHLTFQEYLAAQYVAKKPKIHFIIHEKFHQKNWREVIILIFGEVDDIEILSRLAINIKQSLDKQIAIDLKCQDFLVWLCAKEHSVNIDYSAEKSKLITGKIGLDFTFKNSSVLSRFLYFYLDFFRHMDLFDFYLGLNICLDLNLDINLYMHLDIDVCAYINPDYYFSRSKYFYHSFSKVINQLQKINYKYFDIFQDLKERKPLHADKEQFKKWWRRNGRGWVISLNEAMIIYRNIGHDWSWGHKQRAMLRDYWDGNCLLLECLSSAYIHRDVREWIENKVFLPMSELEKMPPPEI